MIDNGTTTLFHIYRMYNMRPLRRFAFSVEYDSTATSGYKVIDFDPIVATPGYLAKFDQHMAAPQRGVTNGSVLSNGLAETTFEDAASGTLSHYTTAVRNFPATRMPHGRAR